MGFCSAAGNVRAWPSAEEGVQTVPPTATVTTAATPAAAPSGQPTAAATTTAGQSTASSSSSLACRDLAPDVFVGCSSIPISSCQESADRVFASSRAL